MSRTFASQRLALSFAALSLGAFDLMALNSPLKNHWYSYYTVHGLARR